MRDWYEAQSEEVQGAFSGTLEMMRFHSLYSLSEEVLKELEDRAESKCAGLFEIFVEDKECDPPFCHRILGTIGPKRDDFTMLFPFDKQVNASYEAPCASAQERKKQVITNARIARDCPY